MASNENRVPAASFNPMTASVSMSAPNFPPLNPSLPIASMNGLQPGMAVPGATGMPMFPPRMPFLPGMIPGLPLPGTVPPTGLPGLPFLPPRMPAGFPLPARPLTGTATSSSALDPNNDITCWSEHTSEEGRKYWYNSVTFVSTYEKPFCLKTPEERSIPPCPWKEYFADGKVYYSDGKESR